EREERLETATVERHVLDELAVDDSADRGVDRIELNAVGGDGNVLRGSAYLQLNVLCYLCGDFELQVLNDGFFEAFGFHGEIVRARALQHDGVDAFAVGFGRNPLICCGIAQFDSGVFNGCAAGVFDQTGDLGLLGEGRSSEENDEPGGRE